MEVPAPLRSDVQDVTGAGAPEVVCSEFQVAVALATVLGGLHPPGLLVDAPVHARLVVRRVALPHQSHRGHAPERDERQKQAARMTHTTHHSGRNTRVRARS